MCLCLNMCALVYICIIMKVQYVCVPVYVCVYMCAHPREHFNIYAIVLYASYPVLEHSFSVTKPEFNKLDRLDGQQTSKILLSPSFQNCDYRPMPLYKAYTCNLGSELGAGELLYSVNHVF